MKTCEIIIYTSSGALTFEVVATTDDFQNVLASALEEGTVVLDTTDGSRLILNAINVVAIEAREVISAVCAEQISEDTPPVIKDLTAVTRTASKSLL